MLRVLFWRRAVVNRRSSELSSALREIWLRLGALPVDVKSRVVE